jgi:hypothetical protein
MRQFYKTLLYIIVRDSRILCQSSYILQKLTTLDPTTTGPILHLDTKFDKNPLICSEYETAMFILLRVHFMQITLSK